MVESPKTAEWGRLTLAEPLAISFNGVVRSRHVSMAIAMAVVMAACAGSDSDTTTSLPEETTTSSAASSTAQVENVVAYVQAWLGDHFEPMEGVLGPYQVDCAETGPVDVGAVLACAGTPQTEPSFPLDPVGLVIFVIDASGTAAWAEGTDIPESTDRLVDVFSETPSDLSCDDLVAPDGAAGMFSGSGRPPEDAFFWSLVYWSLSGNPDRLDSNGDGIPCEQFHSSEVIASVLDGGPVGADQSS